ncbi:MAG: DUF1295 domain-containing protein [Burkholderiales bacterium]
MAAVLNVTLALAALAVAAWALSVVKQNTGLVDSFWGLFFLLGTLVYALTMPSASDGHGARALLVLLLVAIWALRLSIYITLRNWGEAEDRRYQAIRARNQPGYQWKSLYLVFGLQALLALLIGMPLFAAVHASTPLQVLDFAGLALWIFGFAFEAISDAQLTRFRRDPANRGKVMDSGLWRYTRHPNYFGEAVLWWGFYCIALAAGAWWTLFAPLIMTWLLMKVSGVVLLEKDIAERRPGYREYVARTNAFVPGMPRT